MLEPYIQQVKNLFPKNSKIAVAMSGGVDSSVTAALLKKAGFDVIGLTMQLYRNTTSRAKGCCAGIDIQDAKKVANICDFPHYTLDYSNVFKEKVINDFIDSYEKGITPIPCGRCNQYMKFGILLDFVKKINYDFLATGHYATKIIENGEHKLFKSQNKQKDQSYFLALMGIENLNKVFFPLSNLEKSLTRKIAEELNLNVAKKPESQDICFVTTDSYVDFLEKVRPEMFKEGFIKNNKNEILGKHSGLAKYTIGQRKGININNGPWFVLKLDVENNELIVGKIEDLLQKEFKITEFKLLTDNLKLFEQDLYIQIRARTNAIIGSFDLKTLIIKFYNPQVAITPGQICAIYTEQEQLIAGGIIENVI